MYCILYVNVVAGTVWLQWARPPPCESWVQQDIVQFNVTSFEAIHVSCPCLREQCTAEQFTWQPPFVKMLLFDKLVQVKHIVII